MPCLRKGKKNITIIFVFLRDLYQSKRTNQILKVWFKSVKDLAWTFIDKTRNSLFYPNFLVVHLAEGLIITYLSTSTEVFSTILLHVLYFLEIYSIIKIFTIVSLLREQMIRAFLWLWQCTDCDYPCNRHTN